MGSGGVPAVETHRPGRIGLIPAKDLGPCRPPKRDSAQKEELRVVAHVDRLDRIAPSTLSPSPRLGLLYPHGGPPLRPYYIRPFGGKRSIRVNSHAHILVRIVSRRPPPTRTGLGSSLAQYRRASPLPTPGRQTPARQTPRRPGGKDIDQDDMAPALPRL